MTRLETDFKLLLAQARRLDKSAWSVGIANVPLEHWRGFSRTIEIIDESAETRIKDAKETERKAACFDTLVAALELVRRSLGWQYMSDETRAVVQDALKEAKP